MNKIYLSLLFFLSACVYDKLDRIIVIDNQSKFDIVLVYGSDYIDDEKLFYGRKYPIKMDTIQAIYGPPLKDSCPTYSVWIFKSDSVFQQIKLGIIQGIYEKSILEKFVLI